jgi:ribonuclease III
VSDFDALQSEIGYRFKDLSLLRLAMTHPSVAHEQGRSVQHNQRLEFLGDAVLGLALSCELYEKFPAVSEGPLTKARAQMINRRTLADQARRIHLQEHLILSKGEEANLGRRVRGIGRRYFSGRWFRRGAGVFIGFVPPRFRRVEINSDSG